MIYILAFLQLCWQLVNHDRNVKTGPKDWSEKFQLKLLDLDTHFLRLLGATSRSSISKILQKFKLFIGPYNKRSATRYLRFGLRFKLYKLVVFLMALHYGFEFTLHMSGRNDLAPFLYFEKKIILRVEDECQTEYPKLYWCASKISKFIPPTNWMWEHHNLMETIL